LILRQQLSFSDSAGIWSIAWSPDGNYVAFEFLLAYDSSEYILPSVLIMDVRTGMVIDYCIPLYGNMIWSPDSKLLIVSTPLNPKDYPEVHTSSMPKMQVIIIDINRQKAINIYEDALAEGWMVNTP
jgi:Tol biopolymer transport system component